MITKRQRTLAALTRLNKTSPVGGEPLTRKQMLKSAGFGVNYELFKTKGYLEALKQLPDTLTGTIAMALDALPAKLPEARAGELAEIVDKFVKLQRLTTGQSTENQQVITWQAPEPETQNNVTQAGNSPESGIQSQETAKKKQVIDVSEVKFEGQE